MAKKSSKKPKKKSQFSPLRIIVFLIFIIAISIGYTTLRTYFTPQPTEIMAITPEILHSGYTTVSGTIQKDSSSDTQGNYILVLDDMRVIILDISGLDSLLGSRVSVTGNVDYVVDAVFPMTMSVASITHLTR